MTLDDLVARAADLAKPGHRRILGITGPPGSGKSTLSEEIVTALGPGRGCLVSMDGFHISTPVLESLRRRNKMGAIDTFDDVGYAELIRRLATAGPDDRPIFAPTFRRDIEEPIAAGVRVPSDVPLVVTEGNYLLAPGGAWPTARAHMAEVWFVALPEKVRVERLVARHITHGKSPDAALEWTLGPDQANAELIEPMRDDADLVIELID